ncbi:hypothetical protein CYL21_2035 [Plasmodium falciparum NF54]|uniref:Uncharacterized protein n=2 Tax=Plasmodium falciparum TaxID=5833 RepID=Q8IE97_PLAF7|nr:conserved protein, unknown function [Plasmodium falciparum 3D7]KAF4329891.1 hypothetical protein CYL21_2035 [Plasmodium falciparum NF54]PKC47029.1 hypothetical protein CK202_2648 [Plasmodium falciparum NF54]CAD52366.1 conserved protein, unknown function [Plasmodium falciparum 3D7]|eukprot:XP_001349958.1 conserved Plasmodium protein, unknown function [Plasmodium falciparum 3D7]
MKVKKLVKFLSLLAVGLLSNKITKQYGFTPYSFNCNAEIIRRSSYGYNQEILNDSVNLILENTHKNKIGIIHKSIRELLSGRYNSLNPQKVLLRISNIIKHGHINSLCDNNQSYVLIDIPHIIFNANLIGDPKLQRINYLINNILNNLDVCSSKRKYNIQLKSNVTNGCLSQSDKDIIFDTTKPSNSRSKGLQLSPSNKFFSILLKCSVDNLGSGDSTMECVQKELAKDNKKMSDTCSQCFKDSVSCGKSNCWLPCLFGSPCSDRCYNCGVKYCNKELIRCTGLENLPSACS